MHRFQESGVDSDHDLIISKFDDMREIVGTKGYDSRGRRTFIDMFLHYTSSHFKREEKAMRAAGYPRFGEHVLAHAYLQHEFRSLLKTMPEASPNLLSDLATFRQMFLFHILTHDEAYGEWLGHRNARPPGLGIAGNAGTRRWPGDHPVAGDAPLSAARRPLAR